MTDPSSNTCCIISGIRLERIGDAWYDVRQDMAPGLWDELLDTFDTIELLARRLPVKEQRERRLLLPPRVKVEEVPSYKGLAQAIRRARSIAVALWRVTRRDRVFILRGPDILSVASAILLNLRRKPYVVEILGDHAEALRHSSLKARRIWSVISGIAVRWMCRRAAAVLYMSEYLRRQFPGPREALMAVISDVRLPEEMWRPPVAPRSGPLTLVAVASMEQPYKGHTVLLRAMARLRRDGLPVHLALVGGGTQVPNFMRQAASLGIAEHVTFHGLVPWGPKLFELLDDATLLVMPSLTEGLGKAVLEAMARGLPTIGSNVGGLPELLPEEALFRAGDERALADAVRRIITDPEALRRIADRGYEVAQQFKAEGLSARRREFYGTIKARWRKTA